VAALAVELAGRSTSALDRLWTLLFPTRCLCCGLRGTAICARCEEAIPWISSESCPRCARASQLGRLCARCVRAPSPLDELRAACTFDGLLRRAIHDLKYRHGRMLAPFAAELLARSLARRPLQVDLLVPVPLAPGRRRERGYNQSELIAEELSKLIEVPCAPAILERTRETPQQVGLPASERRENVLGAFSCPRPDDVVDQRIAVIDDVATTGATLQACAHALDEAGAAWVVGLVVARDR
jgi:ComF family protein